MALVAPEAPSEQARRVFQTYDPEGKRFYFINIDSMFYLYIYEICWYFTWVLVTRVVGFFEWNIACISWTLNMGNGENGNK